MNTMVSIVCTNYNKGDWIAEALDSFLKQEADFDFEILIIDDKSTDHSPDIIRDYEKKYPNKIRAFYNSKNLGITKTWIKICKEAKGKYIARCDGDDYWIDNKKLQKQVDLLEKSKDSKWCSTDSHIISAEGEVTQESMFENRVVKRPESYMEMFVAKGFTMSSTWLIETGLIREVNSELNPDAVDDTFDIQLELFGRTRLSYIPEPTVVYRVSENSDSSPSDISRLKERNLRLLDTQITYLDKFPFKSSEYREFATMTLSRLTEFEYAAEERLRLIRKEWEISREKDRKIIELNDNYLNTLNQLNSLKKSISYKVGRAVTWPAKMIRFIKDRS